MGGYAVFGGVFVKKKIIGNYDDPRIVSDPDGSYTGIPQHPDKEPVQDADDL